MGNFVVVDWFYPSCIVTFYGYKTRVDHLFLDMTDFEIILSMDELSLYHSILDCHAKTATLVMPELPRLEWKGSSVSAPSQIISFMKARHMVGKGYLSYLDYVRDTSTETPAINLVFVVREFSNVFPSNLPGIPPDRDFNFCIDLAPGKANMVVDALGRKARSMGSLAFISIEEMPLALDIQSLANRLVRLDISEHNRVFACIVAQSSLFEQIKAR
ncbi:uncharacterized protein [Nicotiana sylvestris]|uniref:uncharacterized protein n=1 Tax=Nicotiana sylvestris TaxID=4096 RepID=UPI00388CC379